MGSATPGRAAVETGRIGRPANKREFLPRFRPTIAGTATGAVMAANMIGPLSRETQLLDVWSKSVIADFTRFVEGNRDIPFIEDILIDCDVYDIAAEKVAALALLEGSQEHQSELFNAINHLMFASYNMGRHQGTIQYGDLRADPESKKALRKHLEEAREAFTPVTTIKFEVVRDKTKSLWERQSEYVGNIRGTALTIAKVANAEIQRRCGLLDTGAKAGAPEGDLSLSAMMKWVRRAQAALMAEGQFARL